MNQMRDNKLGGPGQLMASDLLERLGQFDEDPLEFLELLPSPPVTTPSIECTIELEDGSGTTMRMHVKGARMADLASFAHGFRGSRA